MKRRSRLLVPLLVVLVALPLEGQLTPPSTGGAPEFDYLLQQVAESRRVLVIGAHPDDEDSGLLALLARAYGVQSAYLSLSRGDGGQNLIGPELGVGLGILRSRELEAARAIDGAHQFVTRAYDFGYSRSIDETAALWHPDSILKDAVRIVRRYRPHVIVSVFSGTARDGHGQHQMAGQIAHAVFEAAGDGRRFPELEREEGLSPWRPLKLYRSARFQAAGERVDLSTGELDPRLGLTYHQIAMASRSRHSSQDMGRSQPIGPQRTGVALVTDLTGAASPEFFAGIPREASWLASLTDSLRRTVAPVRLASAVPVLNAARERLRDEGAERRLDSLVQQTLAIAAGLLIDVTTDVERVVPGGVLQVSVHVYNAGPYPAELTGIRLTVPGGWSAQADDTRRSLPSGADLEVELAVEVPAGAHPSQPYHLMRPLQGGMYDWTDTEPAVRGELFEPPLITGTALVQVDRGLPIGLSREATYRYTDQAVGEVRRPLVVMPEMAVRLTPAVVAWSTRVATARTFSVTVTKYGSEKRDGEVVLEIEPWGVRQSQLFSLKSDGESRIFSFEVRRPAAVRDGSASVRA
ncbi:MAG: PIG-L family deacetylase, partial [Gemmatimonadota bacterium]|nr:PIG-L family deacetylase [Gemmatimonadota bacterium]